MCGGALLQIINYFLKCVCVIKLPLSVTSCLLSAPCAVESVLNTLDCSTNKLTISWAPAGMALNYSATALAGDGTSLHCITEGSNCWMDLQCGPQYNVTVRAISSTCEGQSSVPETVNSGKQCAFCKCRKLKVMIS